MNRHHATNKTVLYFGIFIKLSCFKIAFKLLVGRWLAWALLAHGAGEQTKLPAREENLIVLDKWMGFFNPVLSYKKNNNYSVFKDFQRFSKSFLPTRQTFLNIFRKFLKIKVQLKEQCHGWACVLCAPLWIEFF